MLNRLWEEGFTERIGSRATVTVTLMVASSARAYSSIGGVNGIA